MQPGFPSAVTNQVSCACLLFLSLFCCVFFCEFVVSISLIEMNCASSLALIWLLREKRDIFFSFRMCDWLRHIA